MGDLFRKSFSVVIINVFTALLLTISLSNIVFAYFQTYQYADGINNDFCLITFEDTNNVGAFFEEFSSSVNSISSNEMKLLRYNDSANCGVFFAENSITDLNIKSGRNFEGDDFKYNRNVAVVSEYMRGKCINVEGINMIQIGNGYYEVVGFFEYNGDNTINPDSYVYYNLFSENMFNEESGNIGQIVVECDMGYQMLIDELGEKFSIRMVEYPASIPFGERLKLALFSQSITIIPLFLVFIAVILNSINITINWVNNIKKELFIRRICGANIKRMYFFLIRRYLFLTSISYIIGFSGAYLFSNISYSFYTGFAFSVLTVLVSYLATMVMSVLSILIMFTFGNVKSITTLRGGAV